MFTLGTAAKAAGVSKSTIHRAIKSGRMSARTKDGAGYQIDPAELFRVFAPASAETAEQRSGNPERGTMERSATPLPEQASPLQAHLARLEAELRASKEMAQVEQKLLDQLLSAERQRVEEFRNRADELRSERDRWAGVAESSQRQLTYAAAEKTKPAGWWPFRRASGSETSATPDQATARPAARVDDLQEHRAAPARSALPTGFLLKGTPLL